MRRAGDFGVPLGWCGLVGWADESWMDAARSELVKLQAGDEENRALWERFVELSLQEFDSIYSRLGVRFDLVRGESFYHERLVGVVERLMEDGIAEESECEYRNANHPSQK